MLESGTISFASIGSIEPVRIGPKLLHSTRLSCLDGSQERCVAVVVDINHLRRELAKRIGSDPIGSHSI